MKRLHIRMWFEFSGWTPGPDLAEKINGILAFHLWNNGQPDIQINSCSRSHIMPTGHPNLFDYAYKELSQDAVICWLIKWSENAGDAELRELGHGFIQALMNKRDGPELEEIFSAEIVQQDNRIDVLARINEQHVLLIEDKTDSNPHSNQLENYWDAVVRGKTSFGEVAEDDLFGIYFKTGNQSLASKREIEAESQYKVFDRKDFLEVLDCYRGDNAIVLDFRCHLKSLDRKSRGFRDWKETDDWKNWTWDAWEGLNVKLEKRLCVREGYESPWWGWGHVNNPSGGFIGFWWTPPGLPGDCPAYLQIETTNLCFKVDASGFSDKHQEQMKWEWNDRITRQSDLAVKPKVMRKGSTMTVAVHRDGWLRFTDDGVFDLNSTVNTLRSAEKILLEASTN